MMNLKVKVLSNFRRIARFVLKLLTPIFLKLFPIQLLWKRNDLSTQEFLKKKKALGLESLEYSLFSQNGEDGILRYLFSEIGVSSKLFLEFGFGVAENNSLRLILMDGWRGVLMDGSGASVAAFNKAIEKKGLRNVKAIQQFLDLENLKPTILASGLPEQIDLLSIDVDGNDYWFWKDITYLNPRVVVIEYNACLGPEASLTVPYDPLFDRHRKHWSGLYHGASLTALVKLADKKGYVLVGCDSSGVNAFFVRKDCLTESLKEQTSRSAFRLNKHGLRSGISFESQFEIIKNMPYIDIE